MEPGRSLLQPAHEPLPREAKSMGCKHKERLHGLVLNVFKPRDFEEMRR